MLAPKSDRFTGFGDWRLKSPSPSPSRGLNCGRLTATVYKTDDFWRKPKIYQSGIPSPGPGTVMKFSVTSGPGPCPPSAGAGNYTLPDIGGERKKITIIWSETK